MNKSAESVADRIVENANDRGFAPHGLVPPVRALSRQLGSSPVTVTKAIRILVARGVVEPLGARRRRYRFRGWTAPQAAHRPQETRRSRAESIAEELSAALYEPSTKLLGDGVFIQKEIVRRFRCASRTAHAALEMLKEKGLCTTRGNRWIARSHSRPKGNSRVLVLIHPGFFNRYGRHGLSSLSAIENELSAAQWGNPLVMVSRSPRIGLPDEEHHISGCIYFADENTRTWEQVFRLHPSIPLVFINLHTREAAMPRRGNTIVLQFDNVGAGRAIAREVVAQGHRTIAVFSHVAPEPRWFSERLTALRERYAADRGELRGYQVRSTALHQRPADNEALRHRKIHHQLRTENRLPLEMVSERVSPLSDLTILRDVARLLEPCFAEAFADADCTAWICVNDDIAALASHFLRRQGRDARGRVAVVGFDNAPISFTMDICSYDPGLEDMGRSAVRHLLRGIDNLNSSTKTELLPGSLVRRTSLYGRTAPMHGDMQGGLGSGRHR